MREEMPQPCNHSYISVQYQEVRSYGEVAQRLRLQPASARDCRSGGKAREINKIGRGYAPIGSAVPCLGRLRGWEEGRAAKSFGAAIAAGRGQRVGLEVDQGGEVGARGRAGSCSMRPGWHVRCGMRNGGFLRVCAGGWALVGTGLSEQVRRNGGYRPFIERRRKLLRLTAAGLGGMADLDQGARGAIAAAEGGRPPFAARLVPSPFAHAFFPISDGAAVALDFVRNEPGLARRESSGCGAGSGEGRRAPSAAARSAGRGFTSGLEVRRSSEISGGPGHVN